MQPNEVILSVDELNDDTTTADADYTYSRFEENLNRSVYVGEGHTLTSRDTLALYRTFPTVNGNFKGVSKTSFKFTVDQGVDGVDGVSTLTAPMIFEVKSSIPVGTSAAQILIGRQKALALLDRDDIMGPLNETLMI